MILKRFVPFFRDEIKNALKIIIIGDFSQQGVTVIPSRVSSGTVMSTIMSLPSLGRALLYHSITVTTKIWHSALNLD